MLVYVLQISSVTQMIMAGAVKSVMRISWYVAESQIHIAVRSVTYCCTVSYTLL